MGKHEIRLRRQRLGSRGTDRYRNYGAVLKQHEEMKRMKVITRIFTFFLIIAALVIIFITISRWEKKNQDKTNPKTVTTKITNPKT
jgi:uncharacterized membrane protein